MANNIKAVFVECTEEEVTKIIKAFFQDEKKAPAAAVVTPIQPSKRQLTRKNDEAVPSKKVKEDGEISRRMKAKEDGDVHRRNLNLLGHCLFEYIQRAQYYFDENLCEEQILHCAIKFRNIMKIGFTPNLSWINQVMAAYKVTLPQRQTTIMTYKPPTSFELSQIISYCKRHPFKACNLLAKSPEDAE